MMRVRPWLMLVALVCAGAGTPVAFAQYDDAPYDGDRDDDAQAAAAFAAAQDYDLRVSAALAAKGGPRNLALAAMLRESAMRDPSAAPDPQDDTPSQPVASDPGADGWRRGAAAAAGNDVLANQLLLSAGDGATRRAAAQRWATAEPDNLAPLFFSGVSTDALLAASRGRTRFDLHYLDEIRWLRDAYASLPPTQAESAGMFDADGPPVDFAITAAMALWAGTAMPPLEIVRACRDAGAQAASTRVADCRHVAQVMTNASDTLLGRGVGLAMQAGTAGDDAARASAAEAQRRHDWQMLQWGDSTRRQPDEGAAQLVRLIDDASVHTEIDLVSRVLGEAGIALVPTADWQPPPRRQPPSRR